MKSMAYRMVCVGILMETLHVTIGIMAQKHQGEGGHHEES